MTSHYFTYRNSRIHYRVGGQGPQQVVCFHGFGEFATTFDLIVEDLPPGFELIAFDLPFHGETIWEEGYNFKVEELAEILSLCPSLTQPTFKLVGYSMGGRIALSLFQFQPKQITRLVLLAPDGIRVNPWYRLATQTWIGNRLFRYTMQEPGGLVTLMRLLGKMKWMNESILRFVNRYLDDQNMRQKVYDVWTLFRNFRPDIEVIKKLLVTHQVPVRLLYGQHDRMILPVHGNKLSNGLESLVKVKVLDCGHQLLHKRQAKEIATALLV